jgi:hypothetical protein
MSRCHGTSSLPGRGGGPGPSCRDSEVHCWQVELTAIGTVQKPVGRTELAPQTSIYAPPFLPWPATVPDFDFSTHGHFKLGLAVSVFAAVSNRRVKWVRTGPLPRGSSTVWVVPSLKLLPQKKPPSDGGPSHLLPFGTLHHDAAPSESHLELERLGLSDDGKRPRLRRRLGGAESDSESGSTLPVLASGCRNCQLDHELVDTRAPWRTLAHMPALEIYAESSPPPPDASGTRDAPPPMWTTQSPNAKCTANRARAGAGCVRNKP